MLLKDMFVKEIDRDIKGVIKVGQNDNDNIKQELEEYVVTRELQKHFAEFFSSYKRSVNGNTDKMGVWISGFFGSGKSHFLKILSYLLDNKEIGGKRAIDYFLDDEKIVDPMVLADMKLAAGIAENTDVVLFNIDSKSDSTGKQSKDAIVSVFLKVFNEMQGFCGSMPYLADLERHMDESDRFEEFKVKFEENFGKKWVDSRHKFDFIQDSVVEVLGEMDFMSESAARNWCEKANEPYNISIESFAKLVKAYIDRKGDNHHVVFLVDEIGQYIGDDTKLMLNLQTVTEDLGTTCQGKAWVIVTSQQDIDAIAKDMGLRSNDFSKIQGRFDTRLSLSSANADEVIKKRILSKKEVAAQTLHLLYEQKATVIKNLILFNDGAEKKLFRDSDDFTSVYPFIPYQFNLLGSVLTSIRTHGASGKHLSEGERSMIALFKESAMTLMEREAGVLIPFNVFYDALEAFLDHSHRGVIIRAFDNERINPDREKDCFNISVLKTLFMIKYVKEITPNVDNVTSLMVDAIDADRIELKKKVEEALKVLSRETLIQKNGDIYVFLTDEEQEINREIESQSVESAELIAKVSELIFEDIFKDRRYQYTKFKGRYSFSFNQVVDERPYKGTQNNDIGVHVLTPRAEVSTDETSLRMRSGQGKEILVVLPDDTGFIDELRNAMQIEKYLKTNTTSAITKFEQVKEAKRVEMRESKSNAKLFLVESLKNADIYVYGDKTSINIKDVTARINEALGRLVNNVYSKLPYIEAAMGEAEIHSLIKSTGQNLFSVEDATEPNKHALHDMLNYIANNTNSHMKTSMKSLMDRFMKAPYGFVEDDVEWLVAALFKKGDINLTVSGSPVTQLTKSPDEIFNYITKKANVEKLMIDRREKANENQKKSVREVMKELFHITGSNDDDDALMRSFIQQCENTNVELEKMQAVLNVLAFPGEKVVKDGKSLLRSVIQTQSAMEFYKKIHVDKDDFLDFSDDFEPVKTFFAGNQQVIFEKALKQMSIYDDSKTFIASSEVEEVVAEIKAILQKVSPYSDIPKLPNLVERFNEAYMNEFEKFEGPIISEIDYAKERVFEELASKEYKNKLLPIFQGQFEELYEEAKSTNNIAALKSIGHKADALKNRLLNRIGNEDAEIARKRELEEQEKVQKINESNEDYVQVTPPKVKVKKRKNISIRSVNSSVSWQVENEQDIDKYLAKLKSQIVKELDGNTVVSIEF